MSLVNTLCEYTKDPELDRKRKQYVSQANYSIRDLLNNESLLKTKDIIGWKRGFRILSWLYLILFLLKMSAFQAIDRVGGVESLRIKETPLLGKIAKALVLIIFGLAESPCFLLSKMGDTAVFGISQAASWCRKKIKQYPITATCLAIVGFLFGFKLFGAAAVAAGLKVTTTSLLAGKLGSGATGAAVGIASVPAKDNKTKKKTEREQNLSQCLDIELSTTVSRSSFSDASSEDRQREISFTL
jgi:hypothetical protein